MSCAGMTAYYMVIVAQTKIGFLSGGRGQKFRDLPPVEELIQVEEAYARATVALTRARKLCIIFGPLDMKGLMGAATVMMYGTGHCWRGQGSMRLHQSTLDESSTDAIYVRSLTEAADNTNLLYPPVAFVESVADATIEGYKIRRLHLIIVDCGVHGK